MSSRRCFCITRVSRLLREKHGTGLTCTFAIKSPMVAVSRVVVATFLLAEPGVDARGKRRRRPVTLVADFCPFCGKKYPEDLMKTNVRKKITRTVQKRLTKSKEV